MPWSRFDDLYDDTRKIKRAWRANRATVGLHAMAITYCSRHETDGLVDVEWLIEKLPAAKEREKVLAAMVEHGLLEPVDGEHFRVHDYLEHNLSRAQLESKREKDAARKRGGVQADSNGSPNGDHADSSASRAGARPRPLPSPSVPSLSQTATQKGAVES